MSLGTLGCLITFTPKTDAETDRLKRQLNKLDADALGAYCFFLLTFVLVLSFVRRYAGRVGAMDLL